MEDKIEINFNWLKSIRNLLPPKFGIVKCACDIKRDINGHKIKESDYYVIYKRVFLFFKKYIDFYSYEMRPSFKGEISFTYYDTASCGYRFGTLEEAKNILNLIITSPERFVKRY